MITEQITSAFMMAALSGASKTQIIRAFKETYDLQDEEIEEIVRICAFKTKPKQINYRSFYKNPITKKAEKFNYPFTQIYYIENFLTDADCQDLIEVIDKNLRPSTVSDPKDTGLISDYRTSKTADLNYFHSPLYLSIDRKINSLVELSPFQGETMQSQKYEPGEYYKEHWDFYSPLEKEYKIYCEWMGQRTWTTMIYLNDVEEGGETYFKYLKLKVKPKKGMLLGWNNLYRNGLPNYKTMHEALPPIKGNKYVITKWWRSWSLI